MSIFGLASDTVINSTNKGKNDIPITPNTGIFADILGGIQSPVENNNAPIIKDTIVKGAATVPGTDSLTFLHQLWNLLPTDGTVNADNPESFVNSIIVPAERAAKQLGTTPSVIVAVAALETGWGKHIIPSDNGESSNNLFGIKASGRSLSTAANVFTSEFIDGIEHTLKQPFRTYENTDDAVADFVNFLRSNPRYEHALAKAHDADVFIEQIHLAGYATDPNYATKVKAVLKQVEEILKTDGNRQ